MFMKDFNTLRSEVEKVGADFIAELSKQLISADKVASGKLLRSLNFQVIEILESLMIRVNSEAYIQFVDKGRKPGKMPPPSAIVKWIDVRKIKGRDKKTGRFITKDQTAFIIARSIGEKGIKPTNVIQKSIASILKSKKDALGKAAAKDILNILNKILVNK